MNAFGQRNVTLWSASEVAAATAGSAGGVSDWSAGGVSIDSRTVEPGDLFIAIVGPHADGHDFVAQALAAGAAGCVVSRRPDGIDDGAPLVQVGDTMTAMQELARAARNRSAARIAAITGSVGKTGTKDMLRCALAAQNGGSAKVSATVGNLNNHWGLPLSLARMPAATDFGVFEMGMNHAGEIEPLSRLARPDVAAITAIEPVHIEFFDGIDGIAEAKAEIFAGVREDGAAIFDRGSAFYDLLCRRAAEAGIDRIVTFGGRDADIAGMTIDTDAEGSDIQADVNGRRVDYRLNLPGQHLARNSLAVLAVLDALGADVAVGAAALAQLSPGAGRGHRLRIDIEGGSFLLIDESYNASPASMRAAMDVAGMIDPEGEGRRIAVLGDMLELGDSALEAHLGLLDGLTANRFDRVFAVGQLMTDLWRLLPAELQGEHTHNPEALAEIVSGAVQPGDVVMVKGSLGSRVGAVVKRLTGAADNVAEA